MKLSFKFKGPRGFYGIWGYVDFTLSIYHRWRDDTRGIATWRHITLGLRSPLLRQPGTAFKDKRPRWKWYRLRFGYGAGNVYLGVVYIVTTFGRQHPPLEYRKWGSFVWASQPSMESYLARSRR